MQTNASSGLNLWRGRHPNPRAQGGPLTPDVPERRTVWKSGVALLREGENSPVVYQSAAAGEGTTIEAQLRFRASCWSRVFGDYREAMNHLESAEPREKTLDGGPELTPDFQSSAEDVLESPRKSG